MLSIYDIDTHPLQFSTYLTCFGLYILSAVVACLSRILSTNNYPLDLPTNSSLRWKDPTAELDLFSAGIEADAADGINQEAAEGLYRRALLLEPDQPEIMYNLGTLLTRYGRAGHNPGYLVENKGAFEAIVGTRTEEALEMLEDARHAAANLGQNRSPKFQLERHVLEAIIVNKQGALLIEMDRSYEAAAKFSAAQKLDPDADARYYLNTQWCFRRGSHQIVRQVPPLLPPPSSHPPLSPLLTSPLLTSHLSRGFMEYAGMLPSTAL